MTLSQPQLVQGVNQPRDEVLLTCFDGAQTILVSIPRLALDDFVRQRGWGPLAPSDQDFLVDINRFVLLPLIQGKYESGQVAQRTNPQTGRSITLITLSRPDLDRGIKHVLEFDSLTEKIELGLVASIPDLPVQGPGPHFEFNKDGVIDFASPAALDREGNNIGRLRKLHPTLRDLARQLSEALASGNAPHVVLARRVDEYRKQIDQPIEMIDFSLLYVEGVRLANAEDAAREEIAKREVPPLAETERETIQTLLELHGTFILSTAAGAELIAAEERYQRRPRAEREYRAAAVDFAQSLQNHPAIITPDAAEFVLGAAQQISEGANPERSGVVGTSAVQNVAIVLAAGAVIGALPVLGNAIAGGEGLVFAYLTGLLASQSLTKSQTFASVIAPLIVKIDQASRIDFSKITNFLISIQSKARVLVKKSKNFHWLLKAIDWVNPGHLPFNLNLLRKITEFPLSPETIRVLEIDNIIFIGDLVQKTEIELFQFPGIDRSMVNEIKEYLASVGFHLGMEIRNWPPENIEDAIKNAVDPDLSI